MAELRLVLYFFPLDGLLAGALLIIGFYLATGLVHHLLDHDLEWSTTLSIFWSPPYATVIVAHGRCGSRPGYSATSQPTNGVSVWTSIEPRNFAVAK